MWWILPGKEEASKKVTRVAKKETRKDEVKKEIKNSDDKTKEESKPIEEPDITKVANTSNIELPAQEYPSVPIEHEEEKKAEEKAEEVVSETSKEETMKIALQPGESVYNENTGVEVGYHGVASLNGEEQEKRDLEYSEDGTAYVSSNDLNADTNRDVKAIDNNDLNADRTSSDPNALPRTGQEVSEEEFREGKTDQELENMDIAAAEAFLKFLDENGYSR